jgi:ribosomal subunit interface protein
MIEPLRITFRDVPSSPALEATIRERAAKLERFRDRITSCHVVLETPHRHKRRGYSHSVRVDLSVPGQDIVVSREAASGRSRGDLYAAIRDAFDAVDRQLEHRARRDRGSAELD